MSNAQKTAQQPRGRTIAKTKRASGKSEARIYVTDADLSACVAETIDALPASSPVRALWEAGDIAACHVAAALRWRRDWLSYAHGYGEAAGGSSGLVDIHSMQLARAAGGERLAAVRSGIGLCGELRLRSILGDDSSYRGAASMIYPSVDGANAWRAVKATFVLVLEQLAEKYAVMDRSRKG